MFSRTYFEARRRFLDLTEVRSYASSHKGPEDQSLYTDVAYLGDPGARNLLVSVAATHGVEGYCGSAAQLSLLGSDLVKKLEDTVGVLLIHAINPYGFAWDRRVTPEGCDLNRNFVDFTRPLPENPGYDELADHLVPADLTAEGLAAAERTIADFRAKNGEIAFQTARKKGQYTRPEGMFFGGTAPSEPRKVLEEIFTDYKISQRQSVVVVDYHTGLGPYGYGELQTETSSGMEGYRRALEIFGPSVTSPELGTSSSVEITGTQDEFWQRELGNRHTYVCLEFGTYSPDKGREVLRNDHWLFAYQAAQANTELGKRIRTATRDHYNPSRPDWQEMVVFRCGQIHRQAVAALTQAN
ncbi:DUF2817 domain-containing protein [Mesorhizobium sp. LNHC229A00]|uniref:DUF2817 domain-containing protein n=1 Tax=Mesorhizobium sp. LNHC229A00 TaxID=1287240 RepID=UPI0003CF8701|nr:DUF2817 domain-containing protein [Mesorhizobium sp. LNHC229A00]ESY90377.1 hypothetical protein X741_26885 [Mesorhizobium sp. LNHC229A00]